MDALDLSGSWYWLALGSAGSLAIWWQVRPAAASRFKSPRSRPSLFGRSRRSQLRAYRAEAEAEQRAETLLKEVIGLDEFARLVRRGYLEVRSPMFPSRVYLVPERQGPVTVCEHGRPIMRLCVQTVDRVPDYDTVVMHKLMIEGDERNYLRIANRV